MSSWRTAGHEVRVGVKGAAFVGADHAYGRAYQRSVEGGSRGGAR
jgi:hypothetical protein